MISITTKTGDKGESGLITGERLAKDHQIFAAIGDLDELNSFLGLAVVKLESYFPTQKKFLLTVQHTLFYLGAELAGSIKVQLKVDQLNILEKQAKKLEKVLAPKWHSKFLLPGGTELGAYLDISRSVCRRVERSIVKLSNQHKVRPVILKYLNRLSDYLYLLRCFINLASEYPEKQFKY